MVQAAAPDGDVSNIGWRDEAGGVSSIYTHIDETSFSDSDYVQATAAPGPVTGPPSTNRLSWWKADSLALSNGASVPTWNDEDGTANLTKQSGATVTYSAAGGPNGKPMVVFNETGGLDRVPSRPSDPGSVIGGLWVIYNNFPTGPQGWGISSDYGVSELDIGGYVGTGATGTIGPGTTDTSTSAWSILLVLWNGASSKIYQNGGAAKGTGSVTGSMNIDVNVGGASSGGWNGNIAEWMLYTAVDLTTMNAAASYLATKYALSWTTAT